MVINLQVKCPHCSQVSMQQIDIGSDVIDPIFVKKYFLKGKDEAIDIDFEVASIDAGGVIENEGKKE